MASFNVPLALAHWDVEGGELDVLRGARQVIARDHPIFTVESAAHDRSGTHGGRRAHALYFIESLGYEVFRSRLQRCAASRTAATFSVFRRS